MSAVPRIPAAPPVPRPTGGPAGIPVAGRWIVQARQRPGAPAGLLDIRPVRPATLGDALDGAPAVALRGAHADCEVICHDDSPEHVRCCAELLAARPSPGKESASALADCLIGATSSRSELLAGIRAAGLTCRSTEAFCAMSPDLQVQAFMASSRRIQALRLASGSALVLLPAISLPDMEQDPGSSWEPLRGAGPDVLAFRPVSGLPVSSSAAVLACRGRSGRWTVVSGRRRKRSPSLPRMALGEILCEDAGAAEAAAAAGAAFNFESGRLGAMLLRLEAPATARSLVGEAGCPRGLVELAAAVCAPKQLTVNDLRALARDRGLRLAGTAGAGELRRMLAEHAAVSGESPAKGAALWRPVSQLAGRQARPPAGMRVIHDIGAAGATAAAHVGGGLIHPGAGPVPARAVRAWDVGAMALERPASPYRR